MSVDTLQNPRDIFFFFDIEQGNPNGDPDQDGAVRYDDEVGKAENNRCLH